MVLSILLKAARPGLPDLSAEHTLALDVPLKTLNSLRLVVCHRSLEQIHVSRF